jgi:very-short-patch-repair endonuclease
MTRKSDTSDGRVAELARRQHGVVSIRQLRQLAISDEGVRSWHRSGRLIRVHRGVYAVGHRPQTFESQCFAAILAVGGAALVSRRSAAALWELLNPDDGPIHVSVPGRSGRGQHQGVVVHRCPSLTPEQAARTKGVPVTSAARTLADLRRGNASPAELRRAIRQAEVKGLRTGIAKRAAATRSELEEMFLELCRQHRIPAPRVNVRVARLEVDFLWAEHRLVVETDGYRYHRGSAAFENDHDRDLHLRAAGYNPIRLSYKQIRTEPDRIADLLKRELA